MENHSELGVIMGDSKFKHKKRHDPLAYYCEENVKEIVTEIEKIIDQCNEDDFIVAFNMLLRNFQLNKYFNRTVHNSTSHIASHTS